MSEMQTEAERAETQQAQPEQAAPAPMERAEDLVNQASERAGRFFTLAGLRARQMMARAREEAEDMWAEAQDIRRSTGRHLRQPGQPGPQDGDSATSLD